jgi:epoxyqueuosine reductase
MTPATIRSSVLLAGARLGFVRPRVTRIVALERAEFLSRWLAEGRAGDMRFLHHHHKARLDPRTRYPWARTMVSAFVPYPPPPAPFDWRREMRGRIAAYAFGPDYHDVVAERLRVWANEVAVLAPGSRAAAFVDTGAVFEHEWAARAGVGWTGKHTLTLSEDVGSYAFLAEMLLSLELEPDPPAVDRCGTCDRCVTGCPTGAIEPGYRLEPRRCISYLTIEHRGAIDPAMRPLLGGWIFGCDLCQSACPWNHDATSPERPELSPLLADTVALDASGFDRRYGKSAVRRTGRAGLARNAAVALGNSANPAAVPLLVRALAEHDAPLVRSHAAWALGRLATMAPSAARAALERSLGDPDQQVRGEAIAALDGRCP